MSNIKKLTTPLTEEQVAGLKAGDQVTITGTIYTGRDAAHKNLIKALNEGVELPFDVKNQIIYYVGPCPAKPGQAMGSAGPTTSGRMDSLTDALLSVGLRGMIGKGPRNAEVIESMKRNKAVYFAATGGAGALIARSVKKSEVVAYPELGPEAIYKLEVEDFPAVVAIDIEGNDQYKIGKAEYAIQ
jgi:fumarate hydratase subunit beta